MRTKIFRIFMNPSVKIRFAFTILLVANLSVCFTRAAPPGAAVFQTSSENIICAIANAELHCQVTSLQFEFYDSPSKPAWCDSTWGASFGLESKGRPFRICGWSLLDQFPETPRSQISITSPKAMVFSGFECKISAVSLVCKNKENHGFELSDKKQRFF
jgi:hypothetical protein